MTAPTIHICSHLRPVVRTDDGHWFHVNRDGTVAHVSCVATIHRRDLEGVTGLTAEPVEFQVDREVQSDRGPMAVVGRSDQTPVCDSTRPSVWDYEHNETVIGIAGRGHDLECVQRHVDKAIAVDWGLADTQFTVEKLTEHTEMFDPATCSDLGPCTLAHGTYTETSGTRVGSTETPHD